MILFRIGNALICSRVNDWTLASALALPDFSATLLWEDLKALLLHIQIDAPG